VYIPSPSQGVWHLGPFPLRAYALCIIAGIAAAIWLTQRRWAARGGLADDVLDIALWAVPFGLVGGRLYHLATDPELYFKAGEQPIRALYIWDGGLGIPGAVALGALGAWIACRRKAVRLAAFADALAPGLALAQGIGRWGNYFNQELYGKPSGMPWKLLIDPAHRPAATPLVAYYQPTFLYESLWDAGNAVLLLWIDRRFGPRGGRLFAIYLMIYAAGRGWIEALRDDHANRILGLRVNDWMSLLVFLGATAYLLARRTPAPPDSEDGRQAGHRPPQPATTPEQTTADQGEPDTAYDRECEPGPHDPLQKSPDRPRPPDPAQPERHSHPR
jgi:prolipoprotein diacylglyceryl transferase